MRELLKGTYWSISIHGCVLGGVLLFGVVMDRLERRPPTFGIVLRGGGGPRGGGGGSGGRGSPPMRDVGDLTTRTPAPVTKAPRATASAKAQTSPTGPAVLAPAKAPRTKETEQERLERIRRSARPISSAKTPTARSSTTPSQRFSADSIASRLLDGLRGGGSGPGSGGGSGGGTGTGRGTGSGSGSGRGGSGNGRGSGVGDGIGNGSGPGDPFYSAIAEALYDAWDPPSRAEVGRGNPTVGVRITLRADGTVTAFQLSRSSGVAAMDTTVEAMLRGLRQLPAPASFGFKEATKVIDVRFALDAVEQG
jgi:TonB family protein